MKTTTVFCAALAALCVITADASLSAQTAAQTASQTTAQAPAPPVVVTTTKLGGNVYAVDGQGGRISALVGPDGIFLVDAQFPVVTEKIVAALRQLSPEPIKLVVNSHVHGDHTGGNENFAKMGAVIMAQPNLRMRLLKPSPGANGQVPPPAPAGGLPTLVFDKPFTLMMDGETVNIIPLTPGHTDGDSAVKFVTADVLSTGDVFRSVGFPNIDRANGGTLKGMLESMETFIAAAGPNTKVAPGHGDITNRAGLVAHRDMIVTVRDRVAKLKAEGKTVDQVVAAKPTADFDAKTGNAAGSADRFVQQLFAELR